MEYSLSNAYTYIFKSKGWLWKVFILTLLNVPTVYLISQYEMKKLSYYSPDFYFLCFLVMATMTIGLGYCARCTQNLMFLDHNNPNILPKWSGFFDDYLIVGLKKTWYYFIVGFCMWPKMFSLKNVLLPESGIDLALEGLFCEKFEYKKCPDLESMLEMMRENKGFYYKLSFTQFGVALLFIFIVFISSSFNLGFQSVLYLAPLMISYYLLVSAYCAGISGQCIAKT